MSEMKPSVRRVHDALVAAGVEPRIVEFPQSTRTAQDAADAIGTTVSQIVKSLVFLADGQPLLALVSGTNRVDTARLGQTLGKQIARADAEAVRRATGFAIGGVPPVGHEQAIEIVCDRDLLRFDDVWAAAGTPNAVFLIAPERLVAASGARVVDLREEPGAGVHP